MELSTRLERGSKTGWLFNYHPTTDQGSSDEKNNNNKNDVAKMTTATAAHGEDGNANRAALVLLFQDHAGELFHVYLHYNPYFYILPVEGHEREVELGLMSMFGPQLIHHIELIAKEDLDLINHLSGRKRLCLRVSFRNVQDLTNVRSRVEKLVKRNAAMSSANPLWSQFGGALNDAMAVQGNTDDTSGSAGLGEAASTSITSGTTSRWMDWLLDMREYDVKYHMRVAIDLHIFCGLWYDVTVEDGVAQVVRCDDSKYAPAMPRVVAFDIETTKAPLRFPQPEVDQIYMISYMLDGRGYLIVNREIVTADIGAFEYTPRPEYEGYFRTFNEPDEAALLRRFFDEMQRHRPNVYVTYNGDYFDFPFLHARALVRGMNLRRELGFAQGADGAFLHQRIPHLDCFYWVKRDSYLPQGSQGLKAVTRHKLGYDPIEVDPEEMLPLAQREPQKMAAYSVSDAVSTWYLYQKYVHPFIYSLATIIPMSPDDVLRKGSGGLCESLLMVQAEANRVIFPNKKELVRERFHEGHLIDMETYIGGRVEALRSGVYRADLPMAFNMNPDTYQGLIDDLDNALRFTIEIENGLQVSEVTNYDTVKTEIAEKLAHLRDHPTLHDRPIIYHLDVGAMYPNIILTNRLQPYAIARPEVCAGCCFNSPNNEHHCKRVMSWKWRADLFTASRYEYQRVKAQLENESFAAATIAQANLAAVQKKSYGNRKGNVLEGTMYEQKQDWRPGATRRTNYTSNNGYRRNMPRDTFADTTTSNKKSEAGGRRGVVRRNGGAGDGGSSEDERGAEGDSDDDNDSEDGMKAYHKLNENTQFNMLKRRLAEYSRRAYGKVHETREMMRSNVVCQRENSFYVDTVRLFRDRRYEYKAALKSWKKKLDAATTPEERKLCQSRCVQMESLQLAHKCILNSFYGYVMRKGSRWSSMEMAGIVTYLGATLIQMARALVQQIGVTLELDTDGIWCCLPCTFPETFTFTTSNTQKPKVSISYPCIVLNKMVHDRYSNPQYQTLLESGAYRVHSECSIYFEVDGPYLAMLLPASREEGKGIKKRYAVFHPDGRLAELKGFELKRRGELMLIKDFQSQVFHRFLDGETLVEAYASAAEVANAALDLLESRGAGYDTEEILEKITESSNMTRRLSEYPEGQKSLAITTARRIAEFLGPQMVKDKGLACHFVLSRLPAGRPVTERAIPVTIFRAEPAIRTHFLRKWTGDSTISSELDLKELLDWDYYTARFAACVQKIVSIPAALQSVANPVPRVAHPDWLQRRIQQQQSRFRQCSLQTMFAQLAQNNTKDTTNSSNELQDMEELVPAAKPQPRRRRTTTHDVDADRSTSSGSDSDKENNDDDEARLRREAELEQEAQVDALTRTYFSPDATHSTRPTAITEGVTNMNSSPRAQLDGDFFHHRGFRPWLTRQRQGWLHRAKLRRELLSSGVADTLDSASLTAMNGNDEVHKVYGEASRVNAIDGALGGHFIDIQSRALACMWHVLEVRVESNDLLRVLTCLDGTLYSLRVQVPRRVFVSVRDGDTASQLQRRENVSEVKSKMVLPRHSPYTQLYSVALPGGSAGERGLNELSITEGVAGIYEAHITPVDSFIEQVGCCANVKETLHLSNARRRPAALRDVFAVDELDTTSYSSYLNKITLRERAAFIYHVSSSDTRQVMAVMIGAAALVVFVQPAAAAPPVVPWRTLCAEVAQAMPTTTTSTTTNQKDTTSMAWPVELTSLQVTMEVVSDAPSAWRLIYRALEDTAERRHTTAAPVVTLLQSGLSTTELLRRGALPGSMAFLCVRGASEDEPLFSDPFRWARLLGRRLLQRYSTAPLWLQQRLAQSRLSGIPLCNLAQDSCVHMLDVLYMRALHRRGHVLWSSADCAVAYDTIEERPRQVVMPGGYLTWCIELSLSRLDVVAVLFSQTIQEGDDPNVQLLCDRGVTTHFNILRDLLADLLGQAVHNVVADTLLSNVARWLRDPIAACYEPRLIEMLGNLMHRALTAVLLRLAKLGGRTVRVSETAVTVLTPKYVLAEAMSFVHYLTSSMQDEPMLLLLALQPVRYWGPLLVVGRRDDVGLYLDPAHALQFSRLDQMTTSSAIDSSDNNTNELVAQEHARLAQFYLSPCFLKQYSRLPYKVTRLLLARLESGLRRVSEIVYDVRRDVDRDASVTLATKADQIAQRVLRRLQSYFETELQNAIMDEVQYIVDSRELYTAAEEAEKAQWASNGAVGLEYAKIVCSVLELVPSNGVVSKIRNNCMRLCGISPFSAHAQLQPDPWVNYRLQRIVCPFCNGGILIDLAQPRPTTHGFTADFTCPECHIPIAASAMEAHLVRALNQLVINYSEQDFVCSRCHEMAATYFCSNCCGPLEGKAKPIQGELQALKYFATVQHFDWLAECVEAALLCC